MGIDSQDQLDHQDNKGRTPLLRCVHHSNANFAVGLVKRGANVDFVNKCGTSPLFFSMIIQAFSGSTKMFCPIKNFNNRKYWEYPFESNLFSILFPISWYKSTVPKSRKTNWSPPRHYSSREIILFFLENSNLELEFNNFLGTTILMLSSMVDTQEPKIFEKTIKILSEKVDIKEISKKVDIFGSNVCHYTSRLPSSYFFELSKASNTRTVNYIDEVSSKLFAKTFLLSIEKAGGDPNSLNHSSHNAFFTLAMSNAGSSILHVAFKVNPNLEIHNVNHQDFDGNTLAMKVLLNNHCKAYTSEKFLIKLLERGADFSIKNKSGESAFMLCCREGMFKLIYKIFSKFPNFDVNQKNSLGRNCLDYLLVESPWFNIDHRVVWKLFLEKGVEFTLLDSYYRSIILSEIEGFELPNNLTDVFNEMSTSFLKQKTDNSPKFRDRRFVEYRNENDNVIHKLGETLEEEWIFTVLPDQEKNLQVINCRICRRNGHREVNCPFY